jgi:hypothetical protein
LLRHGSPPAIITPSARSRGIVAPARAVDHPAAATYLPAMRGLIAVLVLLGGGWSQLASLDCPDRFRSLQPAPEGVEGAAAAHGSGHAHHAYDGADAHAPDPDHDPADPTSPHQRDDGCGVMASCGSAVLGVAPAPATTASRPTLAASTPPPAPASAGPLHAQDPPPPRLVV